MLRLFVALVLVPFLATSPARAAASDIARSAISGFILPGYEQLTGEAELQAFSIDRLCAEPNAANLATARAGFKALVTAWSRIEPVRFGPVLTDNRLEKILFWPDRKSTGLKQVQAAIATKDETTTSLESLRQKSVALQGLGALEFVLFGTGAENLTGPDGAHRCAFGRTIAEAIQANGAEIVADWEAEDGIASHMISPQPGYADYRTEAEVMQELLGVWVHGMELLRDTRLSPFYANSRAGSNPKAALFWRSGLTFEALRANALGLRDMFIVTGLSDALAESARWAGGAFVFELDNFVRTAGDINPPVAAALDDDTARGKISYLLILTTSLQRIAVQQIGAELGLSAGFSAMDGD